MIENSSEFFRLETNPIYNLKELDKWKPKEYLIQENSFNLENLKRSTMKILHCHDMKGGYLGDHLLNGKECSDFYNFFEWNLIDIFVYFSHYRVTIPRILLLQYSLIAYGWIKTAHRNGVQILVVHVFKYLC